MAKKKNSSIHSYLHEVKVPYKIMLSVLFNFKMRKLLPDDFDHLLDSVDLFLHHKIVPTMQFLNMKKNI